MGSDTTELIQERNRQMLYRYCLKLTDSTWEAEDLVQETCLRALLFLSGGKAHANVAALLMRTARNLWTDQKRRDRKLQSILRDHLEWGGYDEQASGLETERMIRLLVSVLTPVQLTVFLMRDVFQYKASEVAGCLYMSEGAVKAVLYRGRRSIERARLSWREEEQGAVHDELSQEQVRAYIKAFESADPAALAQLALTYSQAANSVHAVGQYQLTNQAYSSSPSSSLQMSMVLAA